MELIRKFRQEDFVSTLEVINEAAQAYRGVIAADLWREPYMSADDLLLAMAEGVIFTVAEDQGRLLGTMGFQDKGELALVRHAYVRPTLQRQGVGTRLLRHLEGLTAKPVLIGTWADATWAINFYQRNGFRVLPSRRKNSLLRKYWSIPARQIETSVVLANGRWVEAT